MIEKRVKRPYGKIDKDKILSLARAGVPLKEISYDLNVKLDTLYVILSRLKFRLREEIVQPRLLKMAEESRTACLKEVAARYGVTPETVSKARKIKGYLRKDGN